MHHYNYITEINESFYIYAYQTTLDSSTDNIMHYTLIHKILSILYRPTIPEQFISLLLQQDGHFL